MRFISISLSNYIGIYNGMGLYDIHIDMTKCRNRILLIRGANGSGKSTLSKAMNLFPDPNDSFIPGLSARKEIVLVDNNIFYKLVFVHNVKQNGDRDTTKAYITKTFNGNAVELNENGNVSSYKDILYSEFGLDANFSALSQLSTEDRGLADKKPAERKRFVNSIISSLDTYNAIYKTLTKRASNYKSMINALVAKLNILGDEKTLSSNLDSLESRINTIQDKKDAAIAALAKENSMISLLDPDGSIQHMNTAIEAEIALAEKEISIIDVSIKKIMEKNNIHESDIYKAYENANNMINSLTIKNQIAKNSIDSLIRERESEASDLGLKIQKLSSLNSGYSFDVLKKKMTEYEKQLSDIEIELSSSVGINDVTSLSKEEYILALETLKDLETYISVFKSSTDFSLIEEIVSKYLETGKPVACIQINDILNIVKILEQRLSDLSTEKVSLSSKLSLLDTLKVRPKSCKDNTCGFIKEAIEFESKNPINRLEEIDMEIESISTELEDHRKSINSSSIYNDAVNMFNSIVREIDKNGAILSKMPNGEMFRDKPVFFQRLVSGYNFEYMKSIYVYIELANLFDIYKQTKDLYNQCMDEYKVYESKSELIDNINADIDRINKSIDSISQKMEPINQEIADRDNDILRYTEMKSVFETIISNLDRQQPFKEKITDCRAKLLENSRKMNEINAAIMRANNAKEQITQYTYALEPLMKDRDKLMHSVQMMKDYITERDELQANYDFIETIKYYSSPTTGIQLVFMELYMGKIISLANELLRLLFNGEFVIQPFVINDTEFRIPCLGSGYLNDDISSMSSSQIGMISMILSFALLHHSSTKYNIIKLDEIDGPLDYNNRVFFTDVLNRIMDIMGVEQCVMISHNAELQDDAFDLIVLRQIEGADLPARGNIIWKY